MPRRTTATRPHPRLHTGAVLLLLLISAILAGCGSGTSIGARAAADPATAAEAYLQIYQPGPLPRLFQTTTIYDRNGTLLAELSAEGRRTWVGLDRISAFLIQATIATEDASFYTNPGVDPIRIAAAALRNVQEGEIVSGASTITMQLARNLFLGPDQRYNQDFDRKVLEIGLAQELTSLYSKDELLEIYLNLLNYGHLAYGPEAAAQVYFAKSAAALTLAEATLLAGIPQQPAAYDLFRNLSGAKERQQIVLDLMVRHGYLTQTEADGVFAEPVNLNPTPDRRTLLAPHFVQFVRESLDRRVGAGYVDRAGLRIFTTLDLSIQELAQSTVARQVAELRPRYDLNNAALVAMVPASGEILAMVGSADFANAEIAGQVNVATSLRQPGSAIKPVLYATAFHDNLISPATVIWDVPVTYTVTSQQDYRPRNYDERFRGPVTARYALANSYNIPAVKLLDGVTVQRMLESARQMGIPSLFRDSSWYGLSLTLGGGEVTLLDLTTAFQTLGNEGRFTGPVPFLAITDSQGRPLTEVEQTQTPTQVISAAAAFLVTDILSDNRARVPAFGANNPLQVSRPAAVKTGTTTDWRDNWTVGYTRYLVAGVWSGNSDGRPMRNTSGLTGAAPIWRDFMQAVIDEPRLMAVLGAPADPASWAFTPPAEVERRDVCPPGVRCREDGEYFSRAWLEASGDLGPLADSVEQVPSAPVYVDQGSGSQPRAYCTLAAGGLRSLLQLPDGFGLPAQNAADAAQDGTSLDPQLLLERGHVTAWVLRQGDTRVNLGPCDELRARVPAALALAPQAGDGSLQLLVDLAAALEPDSETESSQTAISIDLLRPDEDGAPLATPGRYVLAQPVSHDHNCPGHYIMGRVINREGGPVAGVHILAVDQWGNRAIAASKSGPADYGMFDFPIHPRPIQYTLTVVDHGENPLSAPAVIDHLQGSSGDWSCHWVIWQGG